MSQSPVADQADAPEGARELLLHTASTIMREGDIVDISLSELSLRSGLNSALVKYYFGNKAGLMKALLDRDMEGIVKAVDALMAKDMPPEVRLRSSGPGRRLWCRPPPTPNSPAPGARPPAPAASPAGSPGAAARTRTPRRTPARCAWLPFSRLTLLSVMRSASLSAPRQPNANVEGVGFMPGPNP